MSWFHSLPKRARGRLRRMYRNARDRAQWRVTHWLTGRSPWLRDRYGHRFQALSFSEFQYLHDGNPEVREERLMEHLLRRGMTVVDVGANHGLNCMSAAELVGADGLVHAFEPAPETRCHLARHLEINGLSQVQLFGQALGAAPGQARLRIHHEASGLNTLAPRDIQWKGQTIVADQVVEVPLTTLDAHAKATGLEWIDLLKVDVEGAEIAVLRGAIGLLRARRIRTIILEIADSTYSNMGVSPADLISYLDAMGYPVHEITPEGEIGAPVSVSCFPGENFVACPSSLLKKPSNSKLGATGSASAGIKGQFPSPTSTGRASGTLFQQAASRESLP